MTSLKKFVGRLFYREEWRKSTSFKGTLYKSGPMISEKRWWTVFITESPLITLCAFVSSVLSIVAITMNWPEIAQRAGAIMIVVGVVAEFSGARNARAIIESDRDRAVVKAAAEIADRRIKSLLKSAYERGVTNAQISASHIGPDPERIIAAANERANARQRPFLRFEVFLIGWGTLLTCFGDWLTCSMHAWEISTCSA